MFKGKSGGSVDKSGGSGIMKVGKQRGINEMIVTEEKVRHIILRDESKHIEI